MANEYATKLERVPITEAVAKDPQIIDLVNCGLFSIEHTGGRTYAYV